MAFQAHVLKVMIASPGDTTEERDAVERALHGWNAARAEREQVMLLPRRWETDAIPTLGNSGQGAINEQLLDDADILVALFDSRLGRATQKAVSGTAEEIQRANDAGKPVHVYFSEEPLPRDVNSKQLAALRKFKASLESSGLFGSYASPEDLGYQVRNAIEHDLDRLSLGAVTARRPAEEHAVLRAEYKFDREPHTASGKTRMRTTRERFEVWNHGVVTAERVRVSVEAVGDGGAPWLHGTEIEPDILPGTHYDYLTMLSAETAPACQVVLTWNEGDDEQSVTQTLST